MTAEMAMLAGGIIAMLAFSAGVLIGHGLGVRDTTRKVDEVMEVYRGS